MRLEVQKERFPSSIFLPPEKNVEHRHGPLLPNSIRACLCGPSACGKTNTMMNLLLNTNGLKFENVYIFGKTLHQSKYQYLKTIMTTVPEIGFHTFDGLDELPQNVKPRSICIFDDVTMESQDVIRKYYSYGRHKELDCFYLTQSYICIPRHLIRCNINFLLIFKQDELNLKHIYDEHVSCPDLSFSSFKNMCDICWNEPFGYLVIDKSREINNGRFRKGLDTYIVDV